ncbi:MAG: hypothetical protein NVS2B8_10620 [Vulcanimicrobiaceae bacterium]
MTIACALALASPTRAARPLLDRHQWDAYFALYARDASVPWKPATVRLDTYSGAPVDFAAYGVDPADVIVAGTNRTPRALDTRHRSPVATWRFAPPPGYRFETSDVAVPLGSREGFFVVEARRGEAVQQVWINRTSLGLLANESPGGLVLWCADLRSGRALANVAVEFLVGARLVTKKTDRDGVIRWQESARPSFALATRGAARAFVSILPQAPVPGTIVGVRLERAIVRAGERVRFVGFARTRERDTYERAGGDARVLLAGRGRTLATAVVRLDGAGAFWGEFSVPPGVDAGDYAVLASAANGVGGTSVHVDAASDLALDVQAACPCDAEHDVALAIGVRHGESAAPDVPVRVTVVRTPHVVPPGTADDARRWGTTVVLERTVRSGPTGDAHVVIPLPSDGLDATYGIRAVARGATATSRVVVANARVALAVEPERTSADVGEAVAMEIRGFDATDATPAASLGVDVRLSHGASRQAQHVTLDARGRAHVVFAKTSLGSNLVVAEANVDGHRALDAAAIDVEPGALAGRTASRADAVTVSLDRARYRPSANVLVRAAAAGAAGDALLTLEGARTYAIRRTTVGGASAQTTFDLGDPQGAVRVSAAFVRDGTIALGSSDLAIDGPGHARLTELALERPTYAPGETLHATVRDGDLPGGATIALRVSDGRPSGSARFEDAPDLLGTGATNARTPSSDDPQWHAYVAPARSKANDIFAAERPRRASTDAPSIGAAAPRTLAWRVARARGATLDVTVPTERGHYVLSMLKIGDDGDVGAASAGFDVR